MLFFTKFFIEMLFVRQIFKLFHALEGARILIRVEARAKNGDDEIQRDLLRIGGYNETLVSLYPLITILRYTLFLSYSLFLPKAEGVKR